MKKTPKKSARMWIVRDADNSLWMYQQKPVKDGMIWTSNGFGNVLDETLFPQVKWEDEEPTRVSLRIV